MRTHAFVGFVAAIAFAVAGTPASSATRFGSKLTPTTQPANAGKGVFCNDADKSAMCTHVMTISRNRAAEPKAPKDGTIAKLRLIACFPGTFVFQLARANPGEERASAVHTGPAINYVGDGRHCRGSRFDIEEFAVSVPVKRGDYLAVLATKVGFVYSAGDNGSLLFDPPLADGAAPRVAFDQGTGIILLEAEYDD